MTVTFTLKRAPNYRIASIRWKGPWSDGKIHAQFLKVAHWANDHRLRTGKWIFLEPADRTWEVGLEVKGPAKSGGGIRVRTLPACRVASVVYDPSVVSPEVVYHALNDWTRARRKDRTIRSVGPSREVYDGDPWTDRKAAAHVDTQYTVRP
ncbi:MAG TPA: GyrI-like domain-containing protein [Thermoplasmata archaeon]|nr:GyrI-like domain-containing protein [Thermoplasmata archaeon]